MPTVFANLTDHPLLLFLVSFVAMWISARIGWSVFGKRFVLEEQLRGDYSVILTAALTLLGLIVGFSFSMATSRYDQRKNFEEAEANAIGTEYLRADLLPAPDAANVRALLRGYLEQRIVFYVAFEDENLQPINARTTQLQDQLWSAVLPAARAQPTPITALAVSGMNDVLNSQGYTQSAWWYRIPSTAWTLMVSIAIMCNLMIGYGARVVPAGAKLLLILPLLISIAFMLIADIDAPRHGLIRVKPQNLISLTDSLKPK
jgi:hypothetical protein